jgi:hypothetical protein
VQFTELSAPQIARKTLLGATAEMIQAIDEDWSDLLKK